MQARVRFLLFPLISWIAFSQSFQVGAIRVSGNTRLPSAAIAGASGVRVGQMVTRQDLDAAAGALLETGLFTAVNYRYEQMPGDSSPYSITFQVTEDRADTEIRVEIPGVAEETIWKELQASAPLVTRRMPQNASDYYCRAVEDVLARMGRSQKVQIARSVDLVTRRMESTIVPANPPKVADISFEGARVVAPAALHDAMAKLVIGNRYSEREFRQVLDLNVRPLYEDRGYLEAEFPAIRLVPAGSDYAVVVQVTEGRQWTLGRVALMGDGLPDEAMRKAAELWTIHIADWKQIREAIQRMEKVLRREGYLDVKSKLARIFRDDGRTVDLRVDFTKGRPYVLGSLTIEGLPLQDRQRLERLFRLRVGEPMDQPYLEDYVKQCLDLLGKTVHGFDSKVGVRGGTNLIDVTITFR